MITIIFKNGRMETWDKGAYTDYIYDKKCFIVIRNEKWIGIYNINQTESIVIGD